ncbi:cyclin-O [Mugil cephalus]|uniref:cyclin-O n=1 Tax=Mugil cephalus TaxID=48193 RepID=UPI001FB7F44B|nr:cyclin-O [Mugil cephalus]
MVSFVGAEFGSQSVYKRRRMNEPSPPPPAAPAAALTPAQQRQTARHRKQTLMSKLSDSGFEEDLGLSPISSPLPIDASPLRSDEPDAGQLSSWYLQYGHIGFKIQREKEAQFHPCKSLARQPQLTTDARCKLVSWLIPVHKHFHLSFECCCLAVNIMDRFLASTLVAADCFQLLGVTALLIASKQVEVCSPRISHLLSLCCDAFTKEQLCNLECLILLRLNFRLAAPTLAFFLDYYTNCIEAVQLVTASTSGDGFSRKKLDTKTPTQRSSLAQKVCELTLADYAFNKYPPSLTASCALTLASELLKTKQGRAEHANMQPQEKSHESFVDELWTEKNSTKLFESTGWPEGDLLAVKDHVLAAGQGIYNPDLVQECKDNLKLLVSLNRETLEEMPAM